MPALGEWAGTPLFLAASAPHPLPSVDKNMQARWTGKTIRIKKLSRPHFHPLPYLPLEQGRFLLYGNPLNPWMTSLSIPILLSLYPHSAAFFPHIMPFLIPKLCSQSFPWTCHPWGPVPFSWDRQLLFSFIPLKSHRMLPSSTSKGPMPAKGTQTHRSPSMQRAASHCREES